MFLCAWAQPPLYSLIIVTPVHRLIWAKRAKKKGYFSLYRFLFTPTGNQLFYFIVYWCPQLSSNVSSVSVGPIGTALTCFCVSAGTQKEVELAVFQV